MQKSMFDFSAIAIDGREIALTDFGGGVLLIVNTASQCGFTPQYKGLESLYQRFRDRGFTVLGFPCNQFNSQEPRTDAEIQQFCELNFGVSFPMFSKVDVNGPQAHPIFVHLKSSLPGLLGTEGIKWNFTKFLIDREGIPVKRYAPTTNPEEIAGDIEALLNQG